MAGAGGTMVRRSSSGGDHQQLLIGVAVIAYVAGVLLVMPMVEELGRNIPQRDIATDYLTGVVWSVLLAAVILVLPVAGRDRRDLFVLWMAKCFVGLVAMLFYESHYEILDSFTYFRIGRDFGPHPDRLHFGEGTEAIYGLVSVLLQVLPASFHALKLTFSFVGLLGIYHCYRAVALAIQPRPARSVLYLFGLMPTIAFWSSGINKDPIVLLAIGWYLHGVVGWYRSRLTSYAALAAAGIVLATAIRPWLAPIMLAPIPLTLAFERRPMLAAFVALVMGVCALAAARPVLERFGAIGGAGFNEAVAMQAQGWEATGGGSSQVVSADLRDTRGLLLFIPQGAFTALFRPLPGEVRHAFGLVAGLESAFLLFLVVRAITRTRLSDINQPIVRWGIGFIVAWAGVYCFISAFNLGAAVRFRMQIMPALLAVLLYLGRRDRRLRLAPDAALALRRRRRAQVAADEATIADEAGSMEVVAGAGAAQAVR
jgi:hypothetical protein